MSRRTIKKDGKIKRVKMLQNTPQKKVRLRRYEWVERDGRVSERRVEIYRRIKEKQKT